MTRELIIKEIERRIDEISPFTSVDIVDNNLIDGLLNESTEDILMKLPLHLLPASTYTVSQVTDDGIVIRFAIPQNFYRLIALKLTSWTKYVTQLLPSEHPKFNLQYENQWLRGTINRPLAFLVSNSTQPTANSNTQKEIYCFGKGVTNYVTVFLYCKRLIAEQVPDNILEALYYMGAFKVLTALEKPEQAKIAYSQFENFVKRNITS